MTDIDRTAIAEAGRSGVRVTLTRAHAKALRDEWAMNDMVEAFRGTLETMRDAALADDATPPVLVMEWPPSMGLEVAVHADESVDEC